MKTANGLCFALILGCLQACNCRGTLVYPEAPGGGQRAVSEGLKTLSRSISRYLDGYQIEDLTIAKPLRDYSVGLTNLAEGQLLSAVKPGTWRYPLMRGTNAVAAAELVADKAKGNSLTFAGLDTSDVSRKTMEALRTAERLPEVQSRDFEVRRLDCPAILFAALWLHDGSDDIIIPLSDGFERWKACQPCSESQMIRLLKPEAIKKLNEAARTSD